MAKYACPVCGDPNAFLFWVDRDPPEGCPDDEAWHRGERPTIKNVTECRYQMNKAWQSAEFRKLVPDAFDEVGKMLPNQLGRVLQRFGEAHPGKPVTI